MLQWEQTLETQPQTSAYSQPRLLHWQNQETRANSMQKCTMLQSIWKSN